MKEVLPFQEHQSTIQMKIELGIKSFPFFFSFFLKKDLTFRGLSW